MTILDQEDIEQQIKLLAINRRTLAHSLRQHTALGVLVPAGLVNGIHECWQNIAQIKAALHASGVEITDEPDDEPRDLTITIPTLSPLERRNRRAMLAKVKSIWVEGLLEQSLAKELRIALDLTEQPDAVILPLNALVQELQHAPRPLPTGTPIIKVFEQMDGALLILGAPGAGKTTLLLELARDLIAHAEEDERHPIPVVFNLSSWATKRKPLTNWLVEELNERYDVPKKAAQGWVNADALLLLLDGLDEVAPEYRNACIEVINDYRQERGFVPLAICSRVVDYEALTVKLRLQGKVANAVGAGTYDRTHEQITLWPH